MKRFFFGAVLLAFTSLAACQSKSGSGESTSEQSRESAGGTSGMDTSGTGAMADTVVVDTNARGNQQ